MPQFNSLVSEFNLALCRQLVLSHPHHNWSRVELRLGGGGKMRWKYAFLLARTLPQWPSFFLFVLLSCRHPSRLPVIHTAWITDARVNLVSEQLTKLRESFLKAFLFLIRCYLGSVAKEEISWGGELDHMQALKVVLSPWQGVSDGSGREC